MAFSYDEHFKPTNMMDRWILSFTQSLVMFVKEEMKSESPVGGQHCDSDDISIIVYRLYTVVPRLVKFIDQLTNWYVRFNRKRLKGEAGGMEQCQQAMQTLFSVLFVMTRMMAPFTPFLTEHFYQNLRHLLPWKQDDSNASVHYLMLPPPRYARENGY